MNVQYLADWQDPPAVAILSFSRITYWQFFLNYKVFIYCDPCTKIRAEISEFQLFVFSEIIMIYKMQTFRAGQPLLC